MTEITKISTKGQVIIPARIRKSLDLDNGTALAVDSFDNLIIMKKVKIIDMKNEFKKLTERGQKFAKEKGIISEEDVVRRIHRGRGLKNA